MIDKILITGSNGFIGSLTADKLSNVGYEVYRSTENICNFKTLKNIRFSPDIVIHTAAISKVDTCASNPDKCTETNINGTRNLIEAFPNAKFIFFSSYAVYSNEKGESTEKSPDEHCSFHYAQTKVCAEILVKSMCEDYIIYRPSVMFGFYNKKTSDKNYLMALLDNVKSGTITKSPGDQYFNPISGNVVSEIVLQSIQKDLSGVYNLGCKEIISKYQFNRKVMDAFGLDKNLLLEEMTKDVSRIKYATIISDKIQKDLCSRIPSLNSMIADIVIQGEEA